MQKKIDVSRDPLLRTVSSDALLVDGSDATYRKMIHTMMAVGNSFDLLRAGFAKIIGISGPQHELLMLIYRANDGGGIGVSDLAALVMLTKAFVATETSKLSDAGLVEKISDKADRRRVTLRVTELGRKRLAVLSKYQRQVNDTLFEHFDAKDFLKFCRCLDLILPSSERAIRMLEAAENDLKRSETSSKTAKRGRKILEET